MPTLQSFGALKDIPEEKINEFITRRVLGGDKGMIVWWSMKAGAYAAPHAHPHEQSFWILSGRMDLRVGDQKHRCEGGAVGVIPGGAEHEAWFPEDTELIDVFAPPREDFRPRAGAPAYMRPS
jgi:quercetin dioxygenase-like cupin family protein